MSAGRPHEALARPSLHNQLLGNGGLGGCKCPCMAGPGELVQAASSGPNPQMPDPLSCCRFPGPWQVAEQSKQQGLPDQPARPEQVRFSVWAPALD